MGGRGTDTSVLSQKPTCNHPYPIRDGDLSNCRWYSAVVHISEKNSCVSEPLWFTSHSGVHCIHAFLNRLWWSSGILIEIACGQHLLLLIEKRMFLGSGYMYACLSTKLNIKLFATCTLCLSFSVHYRSLLDRLWKSKRKE